MAGLEEPPLRINAEQPGGTPGGVIEAVKRAVMIALKEGLNGSTLGLELSGSEIAVEMEYPMVKQKYPGIWVQFSFSKFINSGVGHELLTKTLENEGTPEERVNWELIREFQFEGTVSLTIMALKSLERDRISDAVVTMLMFARPPEYAITDRNRDTKQFRGLMDALSKNPYVAIAANHDETTPGGQTVTPGVPWDPEQLGYEDTYSFSILGFCNIVFRNDGTYSLRRVDMKGDLPPVDPDGWV